MCSVSVTGKKSFMRTALVVAKALTVGPFCRDCDTAKASRSEAGDPRTTPLWERVVATRPSWATCVEEQSLVPTRVDSMGTEWGRLVVVGWF